MPKQGAVIRGNSFNNFEGEDASMGRHTREGSNQERMQGMQLK